MTKVLHIITRLDMGGSAQNTLLTCRKLGGKYEMVLACGLSLESRMTDSEKQAVQMGMENAARNGVRLVFIPSLVRRIHPLRDLAALLALWRLIRREKPSIVHTHSSKAGLLGRIAAKIAGTPRIVHTPHGHVFYGHFGPLASWMFLGLERWLARFTDRLVALTDGEKNDYARLGVGRTEMLTKIHSGVDLAKYRLNGGNVSAKKRGLGLNQNGPVIGFVGWLLPIKGPDHLLGAMRIVWQQHPGATLVLAGKGDLDLPLRAAAMQMGADGRVKFLGWRDDIAEVMAVFDIFALPSLNEGMGRVLVEAMAAGKPVVASRVGGIPDLVRHGENGLLVPPGDEKALAAGINQLLANPPQARLMGEQGKIFCRQFSLEAMVAKIDEMYRDLV